MIFIIVQRILLFYPSRHTSTSSVWWILTQTAANISNIFLTWIYFLCWILIGVWTNLGGGLVHGSLARPFLPSPCGRARPHQNPLHVKSYLKITLTITPWTTMSSLGGFFCMRPASSWFFLWDPNVEGPWTRVLLSDSVIHKVERFASFT